MLISHRGARSKGAAPKHINTAGSRRKTARIKKSLKSEAPRHARASDLPPRPAFMERIKRLSAFHKVLIAAAALVLALAAGVVALFFHFYGLMGSESGAPAPTPTALNAQKTPDVPPSDAPTPEPTPGPTPEPLTPEEQAAQEERELRASLQKDAESIMASEDVYNILLLGSDGRTDEEIQRSDAMILVSINKATKMIWLTSFMRDTQVTMINPDGTVWGTGHLNWTFSSGGAEMVIATIESRQNFAIHIDNWMQVDFLRFAEVANLVGPVTVTVTPEEAESMNKRVLQVCRLYDRTHGLSGTKDIIHRSYFPEEGGTVTITDGIQILAYCRERHSGGDVARTRRQRDVLTQMWENVKKMSLIQQFDLLETALKYINTDLSPGECASLLLMAPSIVNYDIHTQQCPASGAFREDRDENDLYAIFPDLAVSRNILRASIYGEKMEKIDLMSWCTGTGIYVFDPENFTFFDPVTYTMH